MSTITRDFEVLKGKVLDQRINFDNMADRVIALEDQVDNLIDINKELVSIVQCLDILRKESL